jgi:hypothetical protein
MMYVIILCLLRAQSICLLLREHHPSLIINNANYFVGYLLKTFNQYTLCRQQTLVIIIIIIIIIIIFIIIIIIIHTNPVNGS